MHIREAGDQLLVFDREQGGERLRCSFNLSATSVDRRESAGMRLATVGEGNGTYLGPWSAVIEKLA
jgi:hypothetical protein